MATFIRLTNEANGEVTLVNMDTVSTVHKNGEGSRLYFIGEPDKMFAAKESLRDIGAVMGAQSA